MPKPAQPPPVVQATLTVAKIDGSQEDHIADGHELAEKLGWGGGDDWETNGIAVRDAKNYLVKTLHEAFQAGTKNVDPSTIVLNAVEHLGIDDQSEARLVESAVLAAHGSGLQLADLAAGAEPRSSSTSAITANIDLRNP